MKDAAEYSAHLKVLIVAHPCVLRWTVLREEAQGDMGLLRYRLLLKGDGLLEMFERFQTRAGQVLVTKYSFHWQDADGHLLKRWNNVPHHPEISTHQHHVHDVHVGAEATVQSHGPIVAEAVLALIA